MSLSTPAGISTPRRMGLPPALQSTPRNHSISPDLDLPNHILLAPSSDDFPRLDFKLFLSNVRTFTKEFDSYISDSCAEIEGAKSTHQAHKVEQNEQRKTTSQKIEEAKAIQKKLWETVAAERSSDADQRARLQQLSSQRSSLAQRTIDLQNEISETRTKLELQRKAKQLERERLQRQVHQNVPELRLLEQRTGCVVSPMKDEQLKFTFTLISRTDWAKKCYFVVDVSKPSYSVPFHDPRLPKEELDGMVAELNETRQFFIFVKRMRSALLEQGNKL